MLKLCSVNLRPCYVYIMSEEKRVKALFHCWGYDTRGIDNTYAIVELEDGSIIKADPSCVYFCPGIFNEYYWR